MSTKILRQKAEVQTTIWLRRNLLLSLLAAGLSIQTDFRIVAPSLVTVASVHAQVMHQEPSVLAASRVPLVWAAGWTRVPGQQAAGSCPCLGTRGKAHEAKLPVLPVPCSAFWSQGGLHHVANGYSSDEGLQQQTTWAEGAIRSHGASAPACSRANSPAQCLRIPGCRSTSSS